MFKPKKKNKKGKRETRQKKSGLKGLHDSIDDCPEIDGKVYSW